MSKVAIAGAGWAGLGAAYHLAKQGYDVTLLEAGPYPGGLVAGWKTARGKPVEAGIHGFWYPYANIFSLIGELGLQPFTPWTRSAQYSPAGLEVESPIFQDLPWLPTPLGTFVYTKFHRLPLSDRLSALPLLQAVLDFDNSHEAWQRYDWLSARELFKQYGVTRRLYKEAFEPMLLVGLFAPGEQCSAAATLGMLYYFILAHQPDFDVVWCRGTVGEQIFYPWLQQMEALGVTVRTNCPVSDVQINEYGRATGVVCGDGEVVPADAVIFSVGVTGMQKIVAGSENLRKYPEFCQLRNLSALDVVATRLWFDRKISIPRASNAAFGFDNTTGWTFFDLNALHDEFRKAPGTVVEADFYHANQFLPMTDEDIIARVQQYLATCVPAFAQAEIVDRSVIRLPNAVTHFFPGSYQFLMPATTSIPNVFMSGDWIVSRHGSWSQEKAYVTGLEAANLVIDRLQKGEKAKILPVQADEPHIQLGRSLTRMARSWENWFFGNSWLS